MILDKLVESTKLRVEREKKARSLEEVKNDAQRLAPGNFAFEKALKKPGMSFICEVKKASPSKGLIAGDFPYTSIAVEYERAGADCISVLTEPEYFLGDKQYLMEIGESVSIPLLRKDFTVDEYMIYDAKIHGASAVLLICSILDKYQIKEYISIADSLGLSSVVEAHDEEEIYSAVEAGARIIGVNNRNLKDFSVDLGNSKRLRSLVPKDILFVAESGIKTRSDVEVLEDACVDAVLIGETLMRSKDKKQMLDMLKGI